MYTCISGRASTNLTKCGKPLRRESLNSNTADYSMAMNPVYDDNNAKRDKACKRKRSRAGRECSPQILETRLFLTSHMISLCLLLIFLCTRIAFSNKNIHNNYCETYQNDFSCI